MNYLYSVIMIAAALIVYQVPRQLEFKDKWVNAWAALAISIGVISAVGALIGGGFK